MRVEVVDVGCARAVCGRDFLPDAGEQAGGEDDVEDAPECDGSAVYLEPMGTNGRLSSRGVTYEGKRGQATYPWMTGMAMRA